MTEIAKVKGRDKERKGKGISSFVVLAIVLSVSLALVALVSAVEQPPEPEVTEIVVTANPRSIPLEGTSTITATVTWAYQDDGIFKIRFEITGAALGAVITPYSYSNASGVATATLTAGAEETGMVTVKAWWYGNETYSVENTTTVTLTGADEATIAGNVREVDCSILPGATVELFKDATRIDTDTTDVNGDYTLSASETGDYIVTVSKSGYASETQGIPITAVPGEYTLDFVSNDALVPEDPNFDYVLDCVWLWKGPGLINFDKVLDVVFYWKS